MNPKIKELRKKAMQLPLTPGVYLMKNSSSEIIYVGKAKALKNRVSQYFGSEHNHTVKVRKMVENVDDFDVILTDSEFEALVLECSLIKQHSPKYNILLKDDKGYSYIKVTPGKWRNIYAVLQREDDGAKYIGPYMSSFAARNTVDEAKKIFRLPQCNKVFPRDFGKSRPCLNFFIGQCSGVCSGKVPFSQYNEAVEDALAFIKEGGTAALADLQKRMEDAAESLEFEKAARLRDRIAAIKRLGGKQKVMSADVREQDVFALVTGAASSGKACLSVLRFADGRLYDSENFITDVPEDTAETLAELIRSFYMIRDFVPRRVSVDGEVADSELLERWLSEKKGKKVIISHSTAGEQKKLFEMCRSNAAQYLTPLTGTAGRKTAALDELADSLSEADSGGRLKLASQKFYFAGLVACIENLCLSPHGVSSIERSARMRDMLEAPRTRQMVAALKDNHRGLGLLFGPIASAKPARCVMCTHLAAFLNRTGAKTA